MTAENPEPAADRAQSTPDPASFCEHEWVSAEFRRQTNSGPFADADRLVVETILCADCGETKAVDLDGESV
jgi:hypothetical protein